MNRRGNRLARVREQDVRTEAAGNGGQFLAFVARDFKQTCLVNLDEEQGLIVFLGFNRNGQHYFVKIVFNNGV